MEKPDIGEIKKHNGDTETGLIKLGDALTELLYARILARLATKLVTDWLLTRFKNRNKPGEYSLDITSFWNEAVAGLVGNSEVVKKRTDLLLVVLWRLLLITKSNEAVEFVFTDGTIVVYGKNVIEINDIDLKKLVTPGVTVRLVKLHHDSIPPNSP